MNLSDQNNGNAKQHGAQTQGGLANVYPPVPGSTPRREEGDVALADVDLADGPVTHSPVGIEARDTRPHGEHDTHALSGSASIPTLDIDVATMGESAFPLDGPGEYEVKEVLLTGVRTYRDDARGAERGKQVAFVVELDGLHTIHLGDIGHLLTEEKLGDIGSIDIVCVPVGGALNATRTAELVAQLDPRVVIPMPVCEEEADCNEALAKFFHEMSAEPVVQSKLSVTASSLPAETVTVHLESRGKV